MPRSFFATCKNFSKIFLPGKMLKLVVEPIGVMAMVFAAVFSTGILGVNASKGAVPGDMLYPVKRTSEKVQVGLTSQGEKKAKLHVEFAAERVKEVEKIIRQENDKESKKEKVKIATDGLKEELTKAKEQLAVAKENPTDAKAVVEAAKEVDKQAEELSEQITEKKNELASAVSELGDNEVLNNLNEAAKEATVTSIKAVEVIIEKHQDGTVIQSEGELINAIGSKITKVEDSIKVATDQVTKAAETIKAGGTAGTDPALTPSDPTTPVTVPTTIENVQAMPVQATEMLSQAKDLLNQGDLTSALEKVIESNELTSQVVQAVQDLPAKTDTIAVPVTTPTTTPITVTPETTTPPTTTPTTIPTTTIPSTTTPTTNSTTTTVPSTTTKTVK